MEMPMAAQDQEFNQIIRGKRTKRQRLLCPLPLAITSSSSSSGFTDNINTEEEEDMANCLILLAQGSHAHHHNPKSSPETAQLGFGSDAYQCKTCDRYFSSFQALGGHRASHKKPKAVVNIEDKKVCRENSFNGTSTNLSIQKSKSGNYKVHECSVCGAEFSSGQALGGHMRRHRTIVSGGGGGGGSGPSTTLSLDSGSHEESHQEPKKPRYNNTNLHLDLNLPATAEDVDRDRDRDRREVDFRFGSKEQVIVFSASPLVDCHY
ncbi:hypothetical protein HS088_TW05G00587 [Tripterygium wilfordii]|uniref:C2H2-type domain-containing protein n=1 Tax=Tripterygium wilfordii TaxID=458696 RepID=A0A7J7DND5_TRIWF|nr:zinc finger protein ZAT5-like [Tripterygium wilfordii]KAF5747858.1 hypothetical protein HS088_TW05G00587 [Tripterygium wilfordii]